MANSDELMSDDRLDEIEKALASNNVRIGVTMADLRALVARVRAAEAMILGVSWAERRIAELEGMRRGLIGAAIRRDERIAELEAQVANARNEEREAIVRWLRLLQREARDYLKGEKLKAKRHPLSVTAAGYVADRLSAGSWRMDFQRYAQEGSNG